MVTPMDEAPDVNLRVGMSVTLLRNDLEDAAGVIADLGFQALEVHLSHLGPGLPGVPVYEGHAAAAGDLIRQHGLVVSTLNAVADSSFQPFGGSAAMKATVTALAHQLRLAAAMGSPRLLIYEGRVSSAPEVSGAIRLLVTCLEQAQAESGLADPPAFSVECHPYTWALAYRRLPELAAALRGVGAGICLDFCHFGVALGSRIDDWLDPGVLDAVNHLHYSDTDASTPELHFPPGRGTLDLAAIAERLRGRGLAAGWDLFGWPGPRETMRVYFDRYEAFVRSINGPSPLG
jgi:sugar phosphate isomerase/epimerase